MAQLRVGAAKVCINPLPDMYPIPTTDRDLGATEYYIQSEPYNDMHVRTLVIDNRETRVAMIVYELGNVPTVEGLSAALSEAAGVKPEHLFVVATHNHSAPRAKKNTDEEKAFNAKYETLLVQWGCEALKKAVDTMRPARYGYGETLSYVNTNRDLQTFGGFWLEGRNLAGYSDKTLAMIKFVDMEGKVIAALLNHATHATCIYLMRDADHKGKTSSNFPGIACEFAEQYYGGDTVVLWTAGAAGDQNPVLSHGLQYDYPDGFTAAVHYPDGVGYMQMELMGRTHGGDAVKGLNDITKFSDHMPITFARNETELPTQKFKYGKPASWNDLRPGCQGLRPVDSVYGDVPPYKKAEMLPDPEHPAYLKLKFLKLGDIAMIFINAEVYSLLGKRIKELSPYKKTIIITICGTADHRVEYIQDKDSAHHTVLQHYSRVIPGSSDELVLECEAEMLEKALANELNG